MNYKLSLEVKEDKENVQKLLLADIENLEGDRSTIKTKKGENKLKITIESLDATALRAAVNNVLKILQVYEKTKGLKND